MFDTLMLIAHSTLAAATCDGLYFRKDGERCITIEYSIARFVI